MSKDLEKFFNQLAGKDVLKTIKSEEQDNEILELIKEKNRLQEEVKAQQDTEYTTLLAEKKELELAVSKEQDNQLQELAKEKKSLEVAILSEQQKQEKLKALFDLPKFDKVVKDKTKTTIDEDKLLDTLKDLTSAVNKYQTEEIVKTNITENDFTKFIKSKSTTSLVSEDLINNVKQVINTETTPIRSLQQDRIVDTASPEISNKDDVVKQLTKHAQSIKEDIVSGDTTLDKLTQEFSRFKQLTTLQLQSLGGGGSTKISNMDDVDISSQADGFALKYKASTKQYDFGEVASDLSAVDQNIIPDTNNSRDIGSSAKNFRNGYFQNVYVAGSTLEVSNDTTLKGDTVIGVNTGDSTEDTINVTARFISNLEPLTTLTYDLGSPNRRWRDIYLSGNTIDLAGATIKGDGTGQILISSTGVTLPAGSKLGSDLISKANAAGVATKDVPLFTKTGGLGTAATTFTMAAGSSNASVFTQFKKANGTTQAKFELFSF